MPSEFVCPSRPALGPGGAVPGHSHYIPEIILYFAAAAAARAIRAIIARDISRTKLVFLFGSKLVTALSDAMRTLPSLLLLCGGYGGTAIEYGSLTGQYGLDYCIAEADTTSDMTASTTMAPLPWTSLAPPYVSATTWATDACEHNPNRADRTEQWVQSASSSTFEPAICLDNPFSKLFVEALHCSKHWQLGSEHLEDMCASPHTTSQAIEHMPQPAPEASFTHSGHFDFPPLRSPLYVHPWSKSQLGSTALTIVGHGTSATTQPPSGLATHPSPPTLLGTLGQCNGNGFLCLQNVSPWNATLKVLPRDHSDTSSAGEADPSCNGTCSSGKELAIYQVLEPLSNGTEAVPLNNGTCGIIWPQSAHDPDAAWNAAMALCVDHLQRRGKRKDWVRYELHWNYLYSNKNCAMVQSAWMGMIWPLFLCIYCVLKQRIISIALRNSL